MCSLIGHLDPFVGIWTYGLYSRKQENKCCRLQTYAYNPNDWIKDDTFT